LELRTALSRRILSAEIKPQPRWLRREIYRMPRYGIALRISEKALHPPLHPENSLLQNLDLRLRLRHRNEKVCPRT
jgi:hypothetical protein